MNSETSTRSSSKVRGRGITTARLLIRYVVGGWLFLMLVIASKFLLSPSCGKTISGQINADFKSTQNALDLYKLEGGSYPSMTQGLKALVEKPSSAPAPAHWHQILKTEPLDPWKNPYAYKLPGKKDSTQPELISAGPDGIFGNEDDYSSQDE